jgi:small-conductance mechanosensitive channel
MIKHQRANAMTLDLIKAGAHRVVESAHAQPRTLNEFLQYWHVRNVAQRAMPIVLENIGYFMIIFGITAGSVLFAFIVYRLILFVGLCNRREKAHVSTRWIRNAEGKDVLVQTRNAQDELEWQAAAPGKNRQDEIWSRFSYTTVLHFCALLVRVLIILLGIYIGCSTVGIDVFPIVSSLGIVALVVSFAARDLIVNSASAFYLFATGIVSDGMYIAIQGVRGRVSRVNSMHTQIVEHNGALGSLIVHAIPNVWFMTYVVSRIISLETGGDLLPQANPPNPPTKKPTSIDPRLSIGESLVPRRVSAI